MKTMKTMKPVTYVGKIRVERILHNASLVLSTMKNNERYEKSYFGYTKKEAISLFRKYVREQK